MEPADMSKVTVELRCFEICRKCVSTVSVRYLVESANTDFKKSPPDPKKK
jgi:hypothetical protein